MAPQAFSPRHSPPGICGCGGRHKEDFPGQLRERLWDMSTAPHLNLRTGPPRARGVLHLLWDGRDLLAWAELRLRDPFRLLRSTGPAPLHPFAASATDLADLLHVPRRSLPQARGLILHLPARAAGWNTPDPQRLTPVPAPALGGPAEVPFRLAPFMVPAVPLPREALAPVLFGPQRSGLAEARALPLGVLPEDLHLGGDARCWRRIAHLALTVCARGGFVPGTTARHHVTTGHWLPALTAEEQGRLGDLAAGLPAAVRQGLGGGDADALVASFFAMAVDACVRDCLGPARAELGRSLSGQQGPEQWWLGLLHAAPLPLRASTALIGAIERWTAGTRLDPSASVRLVLRLGDALPAEGDDRTGPLWPLAVLVQSLDAEGVPGALQSLPAMLAAPSPWNRHLAQDALRAAARLYAPLVRLLPAPEAEMRLSTPEALELVDGAEKILRAAGVEVVVPGWWRAPAAPPAARLHLEDARPDRAGASLSMEALATFRWEAAIGGEDLAASDFEALVRSRQPLVRLRTGWVRVDPDALRRVAAEWEETGTEGQLPALAALRLALEVRQEGEGEAAPPVTLAVAGGVGALLERVAGDRRMTPLAEPAGFAGTLRPYQRQGLGWLAFLAELGLGGCLADDMGLGKTVQVLALLLHRRAAGTTGGPTLLVCPTSVLGNWQAELHRFAPGLSAHLHYGPGRPRGAALAQVAAAADVVLTSYALLGRDREDLAAIPWDGVVLDEAQNVKNPVAIQAQAARALQAGYRFALTGTPVENGLRDLWSIFAFALPGYLGGGRTFTREYAAPIRGGEAATATRLRRVLAPFVLRRTKRDPGVADELPPKIEVRQDCPLSAEQAALYAAVVRQSLERIEASEGMQRRAIVLTTLLRLKQICDHPSLFLGDGGALQGRSGKLRRLEELLEDVVGEGDRALIFTQFATWARRLAAHLSDRLGTPVPCLDGSVPGAARAAMVRAFQEGEGPGVFVLSLKAGGAGLNLTAAQHVFHYDRWWNPAVEEQATDRAYRIGQTRSVQVHRLIAPGTLEDRIDAIIAGKAAVAAQVVGAGAGEAWLTELDTAALREILTLRAGGAED